MINAKGIQAAINKMANVKLPKKLDEDGQIGNKTMTAIELVLTTNGVKAGNWSDARKQIAVEQLIYKQAGIETGLIDGLVGESTRYARSVWDARQSGDKKAIAAVETFRDKDPKPAADFKAVTTPKIEAPTGRPASFWPKQTEAEMNRFFGPKGTNQITLQMPFPLRIAWEPEKQVNSFSCNQRIYAPMLRIWQRTKEHYGYEQIRKLRLDMYGGCLNVRKMRGGSAWSIHSWGCAYDVDPARNQLKFTRASASLDNPEYKKFWEFVYDEGAISLGIERNYDWMHFQFARL